VIDATQADDSKPAEVVDLAERIYLAYPRHVGRAAAIKAIRLAFAKIDGAALLALVESYASARRGADPQFTPHPATWFNQGRWADDPNEWSVNNGNSGGSAARPASANREQDRIARNVGALADFVAAHEGNRTSGVRQGALLFDRGEANGGPDP